MTAIPAAGHREIAKAPSGIAGLDEITGGGLPRGRPTLICGSAGCGKTLLAMEFLVRGATEFAEPGVFLAFEERPEELAENVRSLGFDVAHLERDGLLSIDYIQLERSMIDEAGEYDLEGLFIRLGLAIDSIGAKRVVIDTIETLFGGLNDQALLRAELRRLFRWLKDRGVTAIITGERGDGALTRQGLEEYVSDCVILLDNRIKEQLSTRRLRIVKYRGTVHGADEYPFLIGSEGISVLPVTSASLNHPANNERISTGIPRLDQMLGKQGYFRGSSIMVTGAAGTGKSSLAAHLANSACSRGERVLYLAFEESPAQMVRNMRSIAIDLQPWIDQGLLLVHANRPTLYGLESHLLSIHNMVRRFDPSVVIIDPLTNFAGGGTQHEVHSMLLRLVDFLKSRGVTALFTTLATQASMTDRTELEVSSLVDTWLLLRFIELGGERNRGLYILKSRGMAHSNQIREFVLGEHGVELLDVYAGSEGVLTGSLRVAQEAREREQLEAEAREEDRRRRDSERRRKVLGAQIEALRDEYESIGDDAERLKEASAKRLQLLTADRLAMALRRGADVVPSLDGDPHLNPGRADD